MTYRINGRKVTREEFMASGRGIDFSTMGDGMNPVRLPRYYVGDYEGYNCPVTGKYIEGRAAHEENLKRQGCRVLEPGETEQFIKEKPKRIEQEAEKTAEFFAAKVAERLE